MSWKKGVTISVCKISLHETSLLKKEAEFLSTGILWLPTWYIGYLLPFGQSARSRWKLRQWQRIIKNDSTRTNYFECIRRRTSTDLNFDIAFPTLTQDVDRRVRSIISTNDMMNRQIIYLLALNRFYTPDFMNMGQSRNNELVSVASSTLSSQLGNILGTIKRKLEYFAKLP